MSNGDGGGYFNGMTNIFGVQQKTIRIGVKVSVSRKMYKDDNK